MKYQFRSATIDSVQAKDQDLFSDLRLDMTAGNEGRVEFHLYGAGRSDLDGGSNTTAFSPFEDALDARSRNTAGQLYEAHLDVNDPLPLFSQVRAGRQAGTRDEPVYFDGLALDMKPFRYLSITAYSGAAVHFYDRKNDEGPNTLAGAGMDLGGRSTGLSVDYLSTGEELSPFGAVDLHDRLISIKARQRFGSYLNTSVKYRYLNSDPRDVTARLLAALPDADIQANVTYLRQFSIQNERSTDLTNELSQFNAVLGKSLPYQTYDAKVRKLLGPHVAADLGYFRRELMQPSAQDTFNREYTRSYFELELVDFLRDGFGVTLTGEQWKTTGRESWSNGIDVTYASPKLKRARVSAGSYYSLYKYDYYLQLGEREKVRTYYLNGRYPLGASLLVNAAYEYEAGMDNTSTIKLGLRYDF